MSAIERVEGYDIALHYCGEPVLRPGIAKTMAFSVTRDDLPIPFKQCQIAVPEGWRMEPLDEHRGHYRFTLRAEDAANRNQIGIRIFGGPILDANFTLLGPGEATGYPCNVNVPRCDKCGARKEACVCRP
jgi:hypothetical protein